MKKAFFPLALLLFCSVIFFSCKEKGTDPPPVDQQNNGFESFEVADIFARNCATSGCHAGPESEHRLNLSSYQEMLKGSIYRPLGDSAHGHHKVSGTAHDENSVYGGESVIPFNPEKSLLYNLIIGNVENPEHRMPYEKNPLSSSQINTIREWILNGAKDFNGNVPFSNTTNKVYVCSQGSDEIYEIDTDYKVVSRIISVDLTAGLTDQPHNVQVKGDYYYVTLISSNKFLKISRATNQIVGSVDGIEKAGMIVISPDGKKAFVSRSSTAPSIYNTVYAVNIESMNQADVHPLSMPVPGVPHAMALSSNGQLLYVANMSRDRISIINAQTEEYIDDIVLSNTGALVYEPMHIYLSPDDKYLYVNCRTAKKMLVIDTETKQIITELNIKDHPMQSAISQDGNKIYTVSHHDPYITVITKSGTSWTVTKEFQSPAFHHLYGCDLSPDGRYLYVTCQNDTDEFKPYYSTTNPLPYRASLVCVYDVQTGALVKILDTGATQPEFQPDK